MTVQPEDKNQKVIKKAVSGFKFTLFAQSVVLLLGIAKSVILPKLLSVEDYGYWQVYVLYSSYAYMLSLGYDDGVYLIYGKYQYHELPLERLRTSNRIFFGVLTLLSLLGAGIFLLLPDPSRRFSMVGVSLNILLMGFNTLVIYILQITNQMKAYSVFSVMDKLLLLLSVLVMIFMPVRHFQYAVVADVCSKTAVMVSLLIRYRDLLFGRRVPFREGKKEFITDAKTGVSLMIATMVGVYFTSFGRIIIDLFGGVEEYAYYSFGVTVTNLVLVIIVSVSLVLYPALKRLPEEKYRDYYGSLNSGVRFFNLLCLGLYFPAVLFVRSFLPQFSPILQYLHILFAIIILQSKMQLLINTFYNVLRRERALLKANLGSVALFLVLGLVFFYFTRSITAIAACTLAAMMVRCYACEIYIRGKLQLKPDALMWTEAGFVLLYVLLLSVLPWLYALFAYVAITAGFLLLDRRNTRMLLKNILAMRQSS